MAVEITEVPVNIYRGMEENRVDLFSLLSNSVMSGITQPLLDNETSLLSGNFLEKLRISEKLNRYKDIYFQNGVRDKESIRPVSVEQSKGKQGSLDLVVKGGLYNCLNIDHFLLSERGKQLYVNTDTFTIEEEGIINNFIACTYKRNQDNSSQPLIEYSIVSEESSRVLPEITQVDDTYSVVNIPSVFRKFNSPDETEEVLLEYGDILGTSEGKSWETYYTSMFPIDIDSLKVYTIDFTGVKEWTPVETIEDFRNSLDSVLVNKVNGTIQFGGIYGFGTATTPLRVRVLETIPADTVGLLHLDSVDRLPEAGGAIIGGARLMWSGKLGNKLILTYREVSELAFPAGEYDAFSYIWGTTLTAGTRVVACYDPALLVSYETEESFQAKRKRKSLHPVAYGLGETIALLKRANPLVSSIKLKVKDKKSVRLEDGLIYVGPIYPMEEVVVLEGLALDKFDKPVADQYIRIYIDEGDGFLDYLPEQYVHTNSEGKFWVNYIPDPIRFVPYYSTDKDVRWNLEAEETTMTFSSFVTDRPLAIQDFQLSHVYAITKDDSTQGTLGYKVTNRKMDSWTGLDPGKKYVPGDTLPFIGTPIEFRANGNALVHVHIPENRIGDATYYEGGKLVAIKDKIKYEGKILKVTVEKINGIYANEPMQRFLAINFELDDLSTDNFDYVYLLSREDIEYESNRLNGRSSVLRVKANSNVPLVSYTPWEADDLGDDTLNSTTWIHPSSDNISLPVYKPVTPIAWDGFNTVTFKGLLPLPDSIDPENQLAGYKIYGGKRIVIYAETKVESHLSNIVRSEPLRLYIGINPIDSGTILGSEGYIPYGFRLISETFDGSSTISGPTYLTINDIRQKRSEGAYAFPLFSFLNNNGSIMYGDSTSQNRPVSSFQFEVIID